MKNNGMWKMKIWRKVKEQEKERTKTKEFYDQQEQMLLDQIFGKRR